jgi:hypothetical protein
MPMPEPVRYRNAPVVWTELPDARVLMPSAATSMPMPSYAKQSAGQQRAHSKYCSSTSYLGYRHPFSNHASVSQLQSQGVKGQSLFSTPTQKIVTPPIMAQTKQFFCKILIFLHNKQNIKIEAKKTLNLVYL